MAQATAVAGDVRETAEALWSLTARALSLGLVVAAADLARRLVEFGARHGLPDGMPDVPQLRVFAGVLECFDPRA
jgi:hypothetical protein